MVVLGSLPAADSCLSDRHVSLESHPHIPEPLSVVTTEGDRKRETEERVKMCAVCRRVELLPALVPHWKLGAERVSCLFEEGLELTHTCSAAGVNGAFCGL